MTQLFTVSSATFSKSFSQSPDENLATQDCPKECKSASLAIGNFDGLHRGHLALLRTMQQKRLPRPWVVLTFEPHPRQFFSPQAIPFRLSSNAQKQRWLAEHKVDALLVATFDQSLATLAAHTFVETFLIHGLQARHIVVGENFVFGHQRKGTLETLRTFEAKGAFRLHAVPLLRSGDTLYTSSRAREAIRAGQLDEARAVLGRSFEIEGVVRQGKGLGSKLGFPTANIDPADYCQPRFGVYDVSVVREQERCNIPLNLNIPLNAVASFGKRPTLEEGLSPLLELHFLDCSDRLYGETLRVGFERFQRPEHRYESLPALQAQIAKDVALSRSYFTERAVSSAPAAPAATPAAREDAKQPEASPSL